MQEAEDYYQESEGSVEEAEDDAHEEAEQEIEEVKEQPVQPVQPIQQVVGAQPEREVKLNHDVMVYQGVTYEKKFGTLVRKLDREQAIANESQRVKYFQ